MFDYVYEQKCYRFLSKGKFFFHINNLALFA